MDDIEPSEDDVPFDPGEIHKECEQRCFLERNNPDWDDYYPRHPYCDNICWLVQK